MNRFLKYWRITGRGEVFQAQIVNYADDFVILSRRCATEALNSGYISGRVRRRRAWPDSGRKWETCWCPGTWHHGGKCGIASMQLCEDGPLTSAKGTATRHIELSITTSTSP
jgi:hypothetical protein